MFDRITSLLGEENVNKIKKTTVLIVGVGGVGGFAFESLVRSGIGNFVLIDSDTIEESNLNRQIISNSKNIGNNKVDEARNRGLLINPECKIETIQTFLSNDNKDILDKYEFDYIVDACDSVQAKKILIDYSLENDIKLISSMGTAKKMDPTKLEIIDIRKTSYDPLAKILRKYVMDKKTNKKVYVVSSTEAPIKSEVLPSMIFVPSVAGILCANFIINDIIKKDIEN